MVVPAFSLWLRATTQGRGDALAGGSPPSSFSGRKRQGDEVKQSAQHNLPGQL